MEDIRQILLRNPELTHDEELHYLYQYNFLNNNLTPSSKMEDIHFQNLHLDPKELHYLCQETNRPTLGVTWNYLALVYFNYLAFIRNSKVIILPDKDDDEEFNIISVNCFLSIFMIFHGMKLNLKEILIIFLDKNRTDDTLNFDYCKTPTLC